MISFVHSTAAIAAIFLSLPSEATSACLNDQDYKYNDGGKLRPCSNIRINEARRQTLCLVDEVIDACPQTCGVCCEDDPDFEFPLDNLPKTQDCAWITLNNVDTRRDRYCGMGKRVGPTSIRNMCPLACDYCQDPVATPGTPAPTISVSPNAEPTRPPSPMPSPFPTLRPTMMPSISPSQLPSIYPSESPSNLPSSAPSDLPSIAPSESPSDLPSIYPSEAPSNNPTMSIKPSPLPSAAPGEVPVTESPVATPSCVDDATFQFELVNMGTSQYCTWLTQNDVQADKRIAAYCTGEIKYAGCPATCGGCDCPEDDADYTFTLNNFPETSQDCAWITLNNVDTRRANYCGTEVGDFCPNACGFCS